jgi:HNH endonuclease
MPRGRVALIADIAKLRRLVVEHEWRLAELADEFGVSRQTVLNTIRRHNIPYDWNKGSPGDRNGSWVGGRCKGSDGYWLILDYEHPYARKSGYVLEHHLVMEEMLGRYLEPHEVVHHIDGDIENNDPENLGLYDTNGEHLADTLRGRTPRWTEEGKRRILEGVRRSVVARNAANRAPSKRRDEP